MVWSFLVPDRRRATSNPGPIGPDCNCHICSADHRSIARSRALSRQRDAWLLTASFFTIEAVTRKEIGGYMLSLPERLLRSATGIAAGAARELGVIVLPARVRRTRLYTSMVDASLRFLLEQVAQVEKSALDRDEALPVDFLMRRTAGNVVEIAGIAAFHASPVWVLAALADLAGAGRSLVSEITAALQSDGLLDPGRSFQTVEEILGGLEDTAGRLAENVNTPPFQIAELRKEWTQLRRDAARLPRAALPDIDNLTAQWRLLQQEAAVQNRSIVELSSLMALSAIRAVPDNARWLSRAARAGGLRTGEVLARGLFDHYRTVLTEIHRTGYTAYCLRELNPYLTAAAKQFSTERGTLTQYLLHRLRKGHSV